MLKFDILQKYEEWKKIVGKFSDKFLNFLASIDHPPTGHDVVNFSEANLSL